jgi:hypothetical protein
MLLEEFSPILGVFYVLVLFYQRRRSVTPGVWFGGCAQVDRSLLAAAGGIVGLWAGDARVKGGILALLKALHWLCALVYAFEAWENCEW